MLSLTKILKLQTTIFILVIFLLSAIFISKISIAEDFDSELASKLEISHEFFSNDNIAEITFPWKQRIAAAMFIRNNFLWIIFNEKADMDLEKLKQEFRGKISFAEQITNKNNTILRLQIHDLKHIRTVKDGYSWKVTLSFDTKNTFSPEKSIRQYNSTFSNGIFFPLSEYSTPVIEVIDNSIGDMLSIIPLYDSSYGVPKTRKFVDFILYNSAQGVVAKILSDKTYIKAITPGIEFIIPKNNFFKIKNNFQKNATQDESPTSNLIETKQSLIHVPFTSERNFAKIKSTLEYQIMLAKDDNKILELLKLEIFYFVHEFYHEAASLAKSCMSNYNIDKIPSELLLIATISDYMIGKEEEALQTLQLIELENLQEKELSEVKIWNMILSKDLYQLKQLFLNNKKIPDEFLYYPTYVTNKILLNLIKMIVAEDITSKNLKWLVNYIQDRNTNVYMQNDLVYYESLIYKHQNNNKTALRLLKRLREQSKDMKNKLRANILYYDILLQQNTISTPKVILELNKLRLIWRGDKYEAHLLERLGDLYLELQDYHNAFKTFDNAYKACKDSTHRLILSSKVSQSFMLFFTEDAAIEKISNFNSVSLFFEYRDFLPIGKEADNIISSIIEKMIKLNLLDKAILLLNHQIQYRLIDTEKNNAIIKLSNIYNLNNQPELAISNIQNHFPNIKNTTLDPFEMQLNQIIAQSHMMQNEYDKAYLYIKDDFSDESNNLKISILTKQKNWRTLRELLIILTENIGVNSNNLTPEEDNKLMQLILCNYMLNDYQNIISMYNKLYKILDKNTISMQLLFLLSSQEIFFDPKDPLNIKTLNHFKDFINDIKKNLLVQKQ